MAGELFRPVPKEATERILLPSALNPDRLNRYLLNRELLSAPSFPYHIDLGMYSSAMQNLYLQHKNVDVVPDAVKGVELQAKEEFKINNPIITRFLGKGFTILEKEFEELVNQKAPGERMIVIYQDQNGEMNSTEITFGEYTHVSTEARYNILRAGEQPLTEIHTHPINAIFSLSDYYPIIVDDGSGRPLVKSVIVLCPDLQVMAFPTDKTPLLSPYQASDLVDIWNAKAIGEDGGEGSELIAGVQQLEKEYYEFLERRINEVDALLASEGELTQGGIRKRKLRRKLQRDIEKAAIRKRSFEDRITQATSSLNAYINDRLIEFARLINVVLYSSTNTKDFYKFTA